MLAEHPRSPRIPRRANRATPPGDRGASAYLSMRDAWKDTLADEDSVVTTGSKEAEVASLRVAPVRDQRSPRHPMDT